MEVISIGYAMGIEGLAKSLNFRSHCITILYHDARHPMAQPEDVGYLFPPPLFI